MQEYDDTLIEPFAVDGIMVPLLSLNSVDLPTVELKVGGTEYVYERSVPIKGHGAVLPRYLSGLLADGKKPLIVERIERFYVYLAREAPPPAPPTAAKQAEAQPDAAPKPEPAAERTAEEPAPAPASTT
jgi:hypothetical protein